MYCIFCVYNARDSNAFNQYSVGGRGPNANNAMADNVNRNPPSTELVSFVLASWRVGVRVRSTAVT